MSAPTGHQAATPEDLVVFVGPTLDVDEVRGFVPGALVRPPAALGDVFLALRHRPRAVVLIDGLFERVPAVWHKELLWAMQQGVTVFGAASMGALRAAELHPFGMVGVGSIFERFRDGELEDDDEVAVAHLGPDDGYRSVSEAMVNFRATLATGVADGEITPAEAVAIRDAAKARFYPERTWATVLADVVAGGLVATRRARSIHDWVAAGGCVDAKAADARALLTHVAAWSDDDRPPSVPDWDFEHTVYWANAMEDLQRDRFGGSTQGADSLLERVLEQLRLDPEEHQDVRSEALVRTMASAFSHARSVELLPEETQRTLDLLRAELGLHAPGDVERWLDEEEMSLPELHRLVREETRLAWATAMLRHALGPAMVDVLRRRRRYGALATAVRHKREVLREHGLDGSVTGDGAEDDAVLAWWFEAVQDRPIPADLDAYVSEHGLGQRSSFLRGLRREYWYRRVAGGDRWPVPGTPSG